MIVQQAWQGNVVGVPMFRVIKTLRALKGELRKLNKQQFSDIENEVSLALTRLVAIQQQIYLNAMDAELHNQEFVAKEEYSKLNMNRMSFLQEKVKQHWIKGGDENSSYFHACLKKRGAQNHVTELKFLLVFGKTILRGIETAFMDFYIDLPGLSIIHQLMLVKGWLLKVLWCLKINRGSYV